jgi:multidrug efflux pump subunit AcrA (membrane-fusion protein)
VGVISKTVVAIGLAAGLAGAAWSAGPVRAAEEPVLPNCLVAPDEEAKVPAREAGVLVELLVREGDGVRKGQVIARIDDSQPQMEKRKAQAEHDQAVAKAKSDVDVRYSIAAEKVAEAEYKKADESNRRVPGSVTEVERDRLKLNEQKSELQIEQAELERRMSDLAAVSKGVEVEAADTAIERRLVKSPLDGVVVQLFPHQGEWMQPGDPLAHVVRTDRLRVEGYVDGEAWNADDVRDRPVTVEVAMAGGTTEAFTGRIVFTSPVVQAGNTFRVVAEVENRKSAASKRWLLRAGQTATMTIHSRQEPLPAVSKVLEK